MFISNKFFVTLWWKNIMHRVNVCILFYPFIKTIVCFWHFISFHRPVSRVNVIKIGMSRCDEIRPIIQAFQFDSKTVSFAPCQDFRIFGNFLNVYELYYHYIDPARCMVDANEMSKCHSLPYWVVRIAFSIRISWRPTGWSPDKKAILSTWYLDRWFGSWNAWILRTRNEAW